MISEIQACRRAVRDAEQALEEAVYKSYPVGARVWWRKHGPHEQTGHVVRHAYGGSLIVKNEETGKTYRIDPDHLTA